MSDSEFSFEDTEFDSYIDGDDAQQPSLNQKLAIENAFYDAEDKISRDPEDAARTLSSLRVIITDQLRSGTSDLSEAALKSWHVKVLRSLLKLPCGDLASKCAQFQAMVEVLDTNNQAECTNYVMTGIEAMDNCLKSAPQDLDLYLGSLNLVCEMAHKLNNQRLWQQSALRAAKSLLDEGEFSRVEDWLEKLYEQWMYPGGIQSIGGVRIWDTADFFQKISAFSSDDAHLFEIIALDFELSQHTNVEWRLRRLIRCCENFSRVLMNRRTLCMLKQSIATYYFKRGSYSAAYPNLYDAWEANFSLGNTEAAQKQLGDLVMCNILCESSIDPLSTREAQTLQSQQNQSTNFGSFALMDVINIMRELKAATQANDSAKVIEMFDEATLQSFLAKSQLVKDMPIKSFLIYQVRKRKFLELISLWKSIDLEHLLIELAFESLDALIPFIVGMSELLTADVEMFINSSANTLEILRQSEEDRESSVLIASLKEVCGNLSAANFQVPWS